MIAPQPPVLVPFMTYGDIYISLTENKNTSTAGTQAHPLPPGAPNTYLPSIRSVLFSVAVRWDVECWTLQGWSGDPPLWAGDAGPCRSGVETLLFGQVMLDPAGLEWRPSSLGSPARQVMLDPAGLEWRPSSLGSPAWQVMLDPAGLEWRPSSVGSPARQVMLDPAGLEWRPSPLGSPARQVMLDPAPAGLEWRPSSLGSPARQVMLDPAGLEWRPSSVETLLCGQPGTADDAAPCRSGVETLLFGQPGR
ncbi:hypothetical protein NDU88_000348 [Pleurodeles waltl]|uniref:Uncharacterized protein n=1 Tax=Pleurodeles waltl TaxID=8319 RepID=A0AAV7WJE3_PLEWA|nr:hypothetical protein NDU88_000348 [Pleurodeles waltl]